MSIDEPTDVDVYGAICDDLCNNIRTAVVGVVVSYNPAKRCAKVQPARQGRTPDGQPFPLPIVPSAPVLWPRFGGVVVVGNLLPGDPVLLIVHDRELDGFLTSGALHPQVSQRKHKLTDAMVLPNPPGPTIRPIAVGGSGTQFYIGREDGTASVSMTNAPAPGVTTIEGIPTNGIRLGSQAAENALRGTAIAQASNVATPGSLANILAAVPAAADPATVITLANANTAAILGLMALLTSALSTKVQIE